jgi:hypothetical protein
MVYRIVSLDPGTTTGVAIYDLHDHLFWKRKQLGPEQHHESLYILLNENLPHVVVCENFTYQMRQKVILDSVEYIGVAKLWARQNAATYFGSPVANKKFWDDKKIRKLGLWESNAGHAMDATRHLLHYVTFSLKDNRFVEKLGED